MLFLNSRIGGVVHCRASTFAARASFSGSACSREFDMSGVKFEGDAAFSQLAVSGAADFTKVQFARKANTLSWRYFSACG
jgi:hypothetical protein